MTILRRLAAPFADAYDAFTGTTLLRGVYVPRHRRAVPVDSPSLAGGAS